MGRPKKNIFFDDANERAKEQAEIESKVSGTTEGEQDSVFHKIPKSAKKGTSFMVAPDALLAFKRYCLENGTTFSEMIDGWIRRDCADYFK